MTTYKSETGQFCACTILYWLEFNGHSRHVVIAPFPAHNFVKLRFCRTMKLCKILTVLLGLARPVFGRLSQGRQEQGEEGLGRIGSDHGHVNEHRQEQQVDEEVHVIIGMKNEHGLKIVSRLAKRIKTRYKRVNAMSAVIPRSAYNALQNNANILYVEEDSIVYPNAEADLYGLDMVEAASPKIPTKNVTSTAACNDPNSFKIGVSAARDSILTLKPLFVKRPNISLAFVSRLLMVDLTCK
jgi:hypothetical protein